MSSRAPQQRSPHVTDVLDRVLDRGIVIDAEINVSVVGLRVVDVEARIVVAGIDTYLEYADTDKRGAPASWTTPHPTVPGDGGFTSRIEPYWPGSPG